jgi:hypothetical protein
LLITNIFKTIALGELSMAPLMPKATAVWLIDNTCLTFDQIADFCQLHIIEINAIADGEIDRLRGFDPIVNGQLSMEDIKACEEDPTARLKQKKIITADDILKNKKRKYVAVSKRQDRPAAIAWFLKYYPSIPDGKICEMLGTTRNTIDSVRNKTHWNSNNIKPKNPVQLGICTQIEMDILIDRYNGGRSAEQAIEQ